MPSVHQRLLSGYALASLWVALLAAFSFLPVSVSKAEDSQPSEPWLLALEGMAAYPLTAPQNDWFGIGAAGGAGVYKALAPPILLGLKLRGLWLSENSSNSSTTDIKQGLFGSALLAVRVRPFADAHDVRRGTGFWIEGAGGAGLTDGLFRATFEGGLGWLFAANQRTSLGPTLRYLQVIQPSGSRDGSDARILMAGLEVAFFDATPVAEKKEIKAPPPAPKDRDFDGIDDNSDTCPAEPEDIDQFEDTDGCPDLDNDGDGIEDAKDKCPNDAEDKDGIGDEDGCPETDQDSDGIDDVSDKCPLQPEVINGVEDKDGCPDKGLIEFVQDRVVLEERVLFDFEKVRVRARAKPVLAAIVELWRQHPEWKKMRVEGHADERGGDGINQSVSEKRARNVANEMIKLGFPSDKIDWIGWGKTRPIDTGESESAQQRNRRVEFVVTSLTTKEGAKAPTREEKTIQAPLVPKTPSETKPGSDKPASSGSEGDSAMNRGSTAPAPAAAPPAPSRPTKVPASDDSIDKYLLDPQGGGR